VNNWYIIMDGCVAVTNEWHSIFFISFYILVIVIFFNVIIAVFVGVVLFQGSQPIGAAPIHTMQVKRAALSAHSDATEEGEAAASTLSESGGGNSLSLPLTPAAAAAVAAVTGGDGGGGGRRSRRASSSTTPLSRGRSSTLSGVAIQTTALEWGGRTSPAPATPPATPPRAEEESEGVGGSADGDASPPQLLVASASEGEESSDVIVVEVWRRQRSDSLMFEIFSEEG